MANTWSDYYYGSDRATITPDRILTPSMQQRKHISADVMQGAFNLYYNAMQAQKNLSDLVLNRSDAGKKPIYDLQKAMRNDIQSACGGRNWVYGQGAYFPTNWHLGWCFMHLEKENGYWKDDTVDGWRSADSKLPEGDCLVPWGINYFLQEVEKRGPLIRKGYSDWKSYQDKLKRAAEEKKWDELHKQMGWAQKAVDYAGPYLWVKAGGGKATGEAYSKLISTWIGYGCNAHEWMDAYLKIRYNKDGVRDGLLIKGATILLEQLPIFGKLYAGVVESLPGVISYFKKLAAGQKAAIDAASRP